MFQSRSPQSLGHAASAPAGSLHAAAASLHAAAASHVW